MELSRASFVEYSTARILRLPSSKKSFLFPNRASYCMPILQSPYSVRPLSRVHSKSHSSKLFYQPKNSFPEDAPLVTDYGRKTIFSTKGAMRNGDHQVRADKFDLTNLLGLSDLLFRFIRPYIIYGTLVGFAGTATRTWMENAHLIKVSMWTLPIKTIVVLVALLCADGYTSGINQIYDIEIDKINKPYFPVASGEVSLRSAWILTISFIVISVAIACILKFGWLLANVLCQFVLASIYSVPPFSTKRSTIGAILTCASLKGYVFVLGLSAAARAILGLPFQLSTPMTFMATFATLFSLVTGFLKDLSDLEGDKQCNVPTLASIHGPRKIAFLGFGSTLLIYAGAIATAIIMPQVFRRSVMIPAHILLASCLILQAWKLEKANYSKEASQKFYQFMWKLLSAEFIIFPFI